MSTRVDFYEQWLQLMRSWGFIVLEAGGWRIRDAEPRTAYDPGQLYVEHHDASTALSGNWGALAYILREKLANIVTARDGQIMLCAAGVAWHAGVGAYPGIPANGANPKSLGNEACNSGREAYPAAQTLAIIASEAAWCIVAVRNADRVVGHKEWALPEGRKQDPSVDMNQRRRDVDAAISNGRPGGEEDGMAEVPQDQWDAVFQELTKGRPSQAVGADGKPVAWTGRALDYMTSIDKYALRAMQDAAAARQEIAGLRAAVDKLATAVAAGDTVNAEELRTVIGEEMAKVVQVEVSVIPSRVEGAV